MQESPEQDQSNPDYSASIIIPTHNRCEDLCELLDSLRHHLTESHNIQIIVVDDNSTDDTATRLRREFPSAHLISFQTNHGPAHARNTGAAAAQAPLLIFLDSDGVVTKDWINEILQHDDGETILLGSAVDYEGGRVQSLPRRATFLGKSLKCSPEKANTGPSCNLALPKSAFDHLGGFDEEIPYYFEDSDLCIRARKAGYNFQYLPDAVFRHKGTEHKTGNAIQFQEHNSTYAMLKAYTPSPPRLLSFILLNTLWLVIRIPLWTLSGRPKDALRLLKGATSAYCRYLTR
jgi:GT2 family glycosyltransferase